MTTGQQKMKEYMTPEAVAEFQRETIASKQGQREKHGLAFKGPHDAAHEAKVAEYIAQNVTWRQSVPALRTLEYWRLRADFYPYIKQSDSYDDFFIRGVSCHPRLSEYPMCKTVIRDYFVCRDSTGLLQMFNACTPLKEQMAACINCVFIKNHQKGDKKFNDNREQYFEQKQEKRVSKLVDHAATVRQQKDKLMD